MASETSIANRALQKLGASRINNLSENSVNGRACNACYATLRDAELRAHPWSFAIKRIELSADAVPPEFGKSNSYTLPSDCLFVRESDYNSVHKDWLIEGRKILTDESAPLPLRYNKKVEDVNEMDPLFHEVLACKMALEMCEEITQSNSKKSELKDDYRLAVNAAKKANAIERISQQPPEDEWVTVRR